MRTVYAIWRDTNGATAVEYGMLIAAIAVPSLFSFNYFGEVLTSTFTTLSATIRPGN